MFRTLWFYFWFVLGILVCGVAVALAGRLKWDRGVRWISRMWGLGGILPSGARVEADFSALPRGREFVILANHQSYLDIYLLFSLLSGPYRIAFVAKDSLFRIPVLGMAMRDSGHVSIDRSNQRKAMKSIDQAVERSRQGATVVIFPEGTRGTDPERLGEFQIGRHDPGPQVRPARGSHRAPRHIRHSAQEPGLHRSAAAHHPGQGPAAH